MKEPSNTNKSARVSCFSLNIYRSSQFVSPLSLSIYIEAMCYYSFIVLKLAQTPTCLGYH